MLMMNKKIFLVMIGLFFCQNIHADIYRYTASDGKIYYTDKPKHSRYKRIIKSRPENYAIAYRYFKKNKKKYSDMIRVAAMQQQLDEKLVHAVIHTESAYDTNAVSSAGAVGLMQLMPGTAKRYGVSNRRDPMQNINAGTRYLKDLLGMFDSNLKLAIAAYNAGENAVKKYQNSIPPYPETQKYVKKVLALYQK